MSGRARHVYVRPEHLPTEMPGLVLDWRQTPDWEALVTYVEPRGSVVTEWLPAERLRPVAAVPRTQAAGPS